MRPEQNSLEGRGRRDLGTEFAQKQRSTSGHRDEEYEPSSEDPRGWEVPTDMRERC